jgi:hypothetical protein
MLRLDQGNEPDRPAALWADDLVPEGPPQQFLPRDVLAHGRLLFLLRALLDALAAGVAMHEREAVGQDAAGQELL